MPEQKKLLTLPDDVAEKFDLQHVPEAGNYDFGHPFGTINLGTIALSAAEKLVELGFQFLVSKLSHKDKQAPGQTDTPDTGNVAPVAPAPPVPVPAAKPVADSKTNSQAADSNKP